MALALVALRLRGRADLLRMLAVAVVAAALARGRLTEGDELEREPTQVLLKF